jgi:ribA/ribD-fused uncharacterized protein
MKYNNEWLIERYRQQKDIPFLFFWGHQPAKDGSTTKSCFSQWWVAPFEVDGIAYKTTEHWMMAGKARLCGDENARQKILACDTAAQAKKEGRMIQGFDPVVWDEHKFSIVVEGNLHKFTQHLELKRFLRGTGEQVLVEASPDDNIWGIGMAADDPVTLDPEQWKGCNLLGYALMEVRDKIRGT